ncbi:MAG: AbrB/MazE/SpoVT family DNA-binding domain-containing protein, partial [Patescibacteria group bacterium]|nr:AbrB/MazE/SpoVT family DNA-binding domain-containing protein [Patescibacteria group bacterium]
MMIPIMQTVSTKGQLVIPAAIRKTLGIKPGSKVVLSIDEDKHGITAILVDDDPIKSAAGFL